MKAWKFLDGDARGAFSGHAWPVPTGSGPGSWVDAGAAAACRRGVHACTRADLAWWLNHELWEVELDGPLASGRHKLAAPRGRLVTRVAGWAEGAARGLAEHSAQRARDRAVSLLAAAGLDTAADRLAAAAERTAVVAEARAISDALGELTPAGLAAALAGDAAWFASHPEPMHSPYIAACAAGHAATVGPPPGSYREAFVAERAAQSEWIVQALGLTGP